MAPFGSDCHPPLRGIFDKVEWEEQMARFDLLL
jgi:hypothetical protein